jgi:hypothetical protein
LILAAAEGVKRKLGKNPVLLLDEITAELDSEGRNILFLRSLGEKNTGFCLYSRALYRKFFPAGYMVLIQGEWI